MNPIVKTLFLVISFIILNVNKTYAQENPAEYMSKVSTILDKSKDEMYQYLKAISNGKSARKLENKRNDLMQQIIEEINELSTIGNFNSDASLKEGSKAYLRIQKTILQDDYGKIMNLEEIAEKSYDNMEMYLLMQEKANEKLHEASDTFDNIYKEFAANNDVKLIEGELDKKSKKIKKMAETLHYYHEAYLIQLKCFHQERYIIEAMGKSDVNAIQQNINAQTALVEESMTKLEAMKPYEGDFSLINGTKTLLNFFKREAENEFTQMMDFFIKKDNFETIKKNFEAKSKSEKDQAAVDEYNAGINDINAATKKYNDLNNKSNSDRVKQNNDWNDLVNDFNAKHSKI